jgi:hypothetical protein
MAQVKRGDIVVGALGHRHALFGYSGHIPEKLAPGDKINLLNLGGVMGICDSVNRDRGQPFECRVLGTVLHFPYLGERIGTPARVGSLPLPADPAVDTRGIPTIALAGTCMDAGKTAAAAAIISRFSHYGYRVAAFKATGVSLRRDILAMEDAGARATSIFTDFGVVTTAPGQRSAPRPHHADAHGRHAPGRHRLRAGRRHHGRLRRRGDPARPGGQEGAVRRHAVRQRPGRRLRRRAPAQGALRHRAGAGHGPLDRQRGRRRIIREQMGVPAFNALTQEAELGEHLRGVLFGPEAGA